jgi:hypothetical protein
MNNNATQILLEGRKLIDPILEKNGFHWENGFSGKSSGGYFDSGKYIKCNRNLELHFRFTLGLITYRIGEICLTHEDYMRHVAEKNKAKYPGFSSEPLDGFRNLAYDLLNYAQDFLHGDGNEFRAAAYAAKDRNKLSGFQKLFKK